ncbi:MAG: SH3 domain-containing protein [Clostridia bacterium]|nr:SH3 domain-containing protein [Clostridia bacterium]
MKKRGMILLLILALLALAAPAQAGWNPLDVATDGVGIAVYTSNSGGKQAGVLYNGYRDELSLEDTNGLYSCNLTSEYEVWLNQSKAEKNQPKDDSISWYSPEWDALMPSNIFLAEVVQQDAPFYTTPGHKHLSAKHAAGTLVKVCGEFGNDYFVKYGGYQQTGFMPKSALRKVQDITYMQANRDSEHWGLSGVQEMTVYTGGTPLAVGGSATGYSDMSPAVIEDGKTVTVLKTAGDWAQLLDGYFVEARFLSPEGDHSVTYATVKTTGVLNRLNVRSMASTDAWVYAKLCSGVRVQVPAHTEDWASVFVTGPSGGERWTGSVQMQYLVFGDAATQVKSGSVRVRTTQPLYGTYTSTMHTEQSRADQVTVPAGTEMTVIGVNNGFNINLDDYDYFLCVLDDGKAITVSNKGGILEPLESTGVTVKTASSVRMREKPSKEAKSLRTLEAGTKVEVLLRGEGWTIVKYKNQTGYVMSRYLQFP